MSTIKSQDIILISFPKALPKRSKNGKTLSELEKTLWNLISKYIRQLHADQNGYVKCYTCNCIYQRKEMDCGHGLPRTKGKATFFEEKLLKPQCVSCNRKFGGMAEIFKRNLDKEFGDGTWDEMVAKSRTTIKRSRSELIEMIHEYRIKIRNQ